MDRLKLVFITTLLVIFSAWSASAQTSCGTLLTCPNASIPLSGTELMYLVQQGVSKKITTELFLGQNILPFNNVWTGTNTFNNTTTFNDPSSFTSTAQFGGATSFTGAVNVSDGLNLTSMIAATATHQFYEVSGALVHRLPDRLFLGDAAANNGNDVCPNSDWWSIAVGSIAGCELNYAQVGILYDITNPNASLGVPMPALTAAVETVNAATNATARAIEGFAYVNPTNGSADVSGWGFYGEGHYLSGTGQVFAAELEARAESAVSTTWNPYIGTDANPAAIGMNIGCGAGISNSVQPAYTCTTALYITANPQQFSSGIIFLDGSLAQDATGGTTIGAIELPEGYSVQWYSSSSPGSVGGTITGDGAGDISIATNGTGGHLLVNGQQVYCGSGATSAC